MREFTVIIERDEDGWLVGGLPAIKNYVVLLCLENDDLLTC